MTGVLERLPVGVLDLGRNGEVRFEGLISIVHIFFRAGEPAALLKLCFGVESLLPPTPFAIFSLFSSLVKASMNADHTFPCPGLIREPGTGLCPASLCCIVSKRVAVDAASQAFFGSSRFRFSIPVNSLNTGMLQLWQLNKRNTAVAIYCALYCSTCCDYYDG